MFGFPLHALLTNIFRIAARLGSAYHYPYSKVLQLWSLLSSILTYIGSASRSAFQTVATVVSILSKPRFLTFLVNNPSSA